MNDLGSGSNVDLCIITKDGVEYLRNHEYLQVGAAWRCLVLVPVLWVVVACVCLCVWCVVCGVVRGGVWQEGPYGREACLLRHQAGRQHWEGAPPPRVGRRGWLAGQARSLG